MVAGLERVREEVGFDLGAALGALGDGVNLGLVEGAADEQAHSAGVADKALDATGGEGQGPGAEVAGEAVVAGGTFQGGNVEDGDKVAVVRRVFELPLPVAEEAHGWE